MTDCPQHVSCPEYNELSRRQFLAASGTAAAILASAPAWLPRVAFARDYHAAAQDVIISLYLRGGCDGLSVVVPWNETNYTNARPNIKLLGPGAGANSVIDLASTATSPTAPGGQVAFGAHPAMQPLMQAYNNSHLLFVQATGLTNTNKSHFDAQKYMEVGKLNDPTLLTGWLGRHLYSIDPMNPNAVLRAIGIADGLQRSLVGGLKALPIPDLSGALGTVPALTAFTSYGLKGTTASRANRQAAMGDMYGPSADPVHAAAISTLNTINMLNTIGAAGYTPQGGAVYPDTSLGRSFRSAAALIAANVGVEAIAIDYSGWDLHANLGSASGVVAGTLMYNQIATMAQALGAFYTDVMASRQLNATVVTMSEFGRRVGENGTFGVDHGYGNFMMAMGRAVNGGRVLTNWPGIGGSQPATSVDLGVTIDYRDILAEIVQSRLGNANLGYVFPGYTWTNRHALV